MVNRVWECRSVLPYTCEAEAQERQVQGLPGSQSVFKGGLCNLIFAPRETLKGLGCSSVVKFWADPGFSNSTVKEIKTVVCMLGSGTLIGTTGD